MENLKKANNMIMSLNLKQTKNFFRIISNFYSTMHHAFYFSGKLATPDRRSLLLGTQQGVQYFESYANPPGV